jgi:hypothetical protein
LVFAATLAMLLVETALGVPLQKCHTATGKSCDIISFELAGTPSCSGAIVASWREHACIPLAKWNTWLDYLFMICYSNCVALGIVCLLGFPLSSAWKSAGRVLAWAQWIVLASDATENIALLQILYGTARTPWPQVSFVCAVIKFVLLTVGLVYLLTTFVRVRRQQI